MENEVVINSGAIAIMYLISLYGDKNMMIAPHIRQDKKMRKSIRVKKGKYFFTFDILYIMQIVKIKIPIYEYI